MEYTYSAFISYRHRPADIAAAKAVERALETYHIPRDIRKKTGVGKLKRCFRDQDELPLADDLGSSIEKALQESEWLIVICSPELPQSPWCRREIDYFISLGRRSRIIPVLIAGEPKDSYPPQITHAGPDGSGDEVEPLAADLRGGMQKQLKTEKLRIIARILDLDFNDLKKREKERALRKALALVSGVTAVALLFAAYAVYKNRLLRKERNAAARSAAEMLIEKSIRSTAEGEIGSGLTYALQAYDGSRLFADEYDTAVSAALEAALYPNLYSRIGSLKDNGTLHRHATLSNDGRAVACRQSNNTLQVYDSVTGEKRFSIRDFGWYGRKTPDISPDSRYVCRFSDDAITLYGISDGAEVLTAAPEDGWVIPAYWVTALNEVPVVRTEDGAAALFDPFTKQITVLEGVSVPAPGEQSVAVHRSGRRAVWTDGSRTWITDTESRKVLLTLETSGGEYTRDSLYFRYRDGDEYVYLRWDTLEEACRDRHWGVLSPDGKALATAGAKEVTLWDTQTGEVIWTTRYMNGSESCTLAFADGDTLIASHENLQIYRVGDGEMVFDSGEDKTYSFDCAAGRLVMPLRSGGCLVNLMPEEENVLPRLTVESRENVSEDVLAGTTSAFPLVGNWDGMEFGIFVGDELLTLEMEEPGLVYLFEDREYILHPTKGVSASMNGWDYAMHEVYVSPDGDWQAVIRADEADIFRAKEGPEPVLTIAGNGLERLCAAFYGDMLALGAPQENVSVYDLTTGDCIGTIDRTAQCWDIQFSPDGRHLIAFSADEAQAVVADTDRFAVIMRIPVTDIYAQPSVGFTKDGAEAVVLYPDGHADVSILYTGLDTLVEKARKYTE